MKKLHSQLRSISFGEGAQTSLKFFRKFLLGCDKGNTISKAYLVRQLDIMESMTWSGTVEDKIQKAFEEYEKRKQVTKSEESTPVKKFNCLDLH